MIMILKIKTFDGDIKFIELLELPEIHMRRSEVFKSMKDNYNYTENIIGVMFIKYKKSYLDKVVKDTMEMDKHNKYTLYDHGQVIWEYNGKTDD